MEGRLCITSELQNRNILFGDRRKIANESAASHLPTTQSALTCILAEPKKVPSPCKLFARLAIELVRKA